MRARVVTAAEKAIAHQVATAEFDRLKDDWCRRIQYIWMISMLNCGLSVRTIKRVLMENAEVMEGYEAYATSGDIQGDDNLESVLRSKGFEITPIKARR